MSAESVTVRGMPCPSCGLQVYFDDEGLRAMHALPECEWFAEACDAAGANVTSEATIIDDEPDA